MEIRYNRKTIILLQLYIFSDASYLALFPPVLLSYLGLGFFFITVELISSQNPVQTKKKKTLYSLIYINIDTSIRMRGWNNTTLFVGI